MADEARVQRQAALADKKQRLDELKARRNQRTHADAGSRAEAAKVKTAASTNLNEYIDGLLKTPTAASGAEETSLASMAVGGENGNGTAAAGGAAALQQVSAPTSDNAIAESSAGAPAGTVPASMAAAAASSKNTESFETGTQTAEEDFPPPSDMEEEDELGLLAALPEDNMGSVNLQEASYLDDPFGSSEPEVAKVLTAEEMEREVTSQTFSSFLNTASKKVERVLGSPMLSDLLYDYFGETDGSKRVETKASDGSKCLSSRQIYECPKWTATRDVTDMDWSPLHRELMLTSYHMPSSTSSLGQPVGSSAVKALSPDDTPSSSLAPRSGELQSDGLVLVWSLAMPTRPEHIFTCGSPVMTARFHPTESPLVIGGCQSGQVVVWDVRAGRMPVQKSSLTTSATGGKGHTHPICAMEIVEGGVSSISCYFCCCCCWKGRGYRGGSIACDTDIFFFCVCDSLGRIGDGSLGRSSQLLVVGQFT
jgi:hypothetical protein